MEPPPKPSESDCCNSGCNPCILDVYEEQLRKYKNSSGGNKRTFPTNCMSPTTYTVFKLVKIIEHTLDTRLLTFQYVKPYKEDSPRPNYDWGLVYKPGQHFLLKGHLSCDKDSQFTRAYTPIPTSDTDHTKFTVLVRLYQLGLMSQFLNNLKINEETLWRGPYGSYQIDYRFSYMLLIAQGTGIAPLYAIVGDVLGNLDCETFLMLFYCCRTEQDILLRNQLYDLSSFWNFSYEVFLSNPSDVSVSCKYNEVLRTKRLGNDALKAYVQGKTNLQVLICGSEAFNRDMLKNCVECGVEASRTFLF